jgi:hypothetical protein
VHQKFTPIILATLEVEIRRVTIQSQPLTDVEIVQETLSQNYPTQNNAGRVAQVVESLHSKCEALSLNPSTTKRRKRNTY